MITRIHLILQAKNLTASQFADEVGVQRSSISHILSGRNNPSLDFILKILSRYPEINSDWLLFGKGSMYSSQNSTPLPSLEVNTQDIDLFSEESLLSKKQEEKSDPSLFQQELSIQPIGKITEKEIEDVKSKPLSEELSKEVENTIETKEEKVDQKYSMEKNTKGIKKIIILNNDNTFEEYYKRE